MLTTAHIFLFILIGYLEAKLPMISYHGLECLGFKVAGFLVHQLALLASSTTSSKVGSRMGDIIAHGFYHTSDLHEMLVTEYNPVVWCPHRIASLRVTWRDITPLGSSYPLSNGLAVPSTSFK